MGPKAAQAKPEFPVGRGDVENDSGRLHDPLLVRRKGHVGRYLIAVFCPGGAEND
jgi:hypothetical protein